MRYQPIALDGMTNHRNFSIPKFIEGYICCFNIMHSLVLLEVESFCEFSYIKIFLRKRHKLISFFTRHFDVPILNMMTHLWTKKIFS